MKEWVITPTEDIQVVYTQKNKKIKYFFPANCSLA